MRPKTFVDPTDALSPGSGAGDVLSAEQVGSWRDRGFALVTGVIPDATVAAARNDVWAVFPKPGSAEAAAITDFGSGGRMTFPSESEALNSVTLHPRLLRAVGQLLGTPTSELRLSQSDAWPKYGRSEANDDAFDNDDQRIHVDYPNHTLVHPPRWDAPEAVEALLYLSDAQDCAGETAVVPRRGEDDPAYASPLVATPGVGALPWINSRESAESHLGEVAPEIARWRAEHLYTREVYARYRVGTLLLYRHDTWHRGTPLRAGALRIALNLTFRLASSDWISTLHAGPAWGMYRRSRVMEKLVAQASVEQRGVLGFPQPGHGYWTPETLDAVEARYGALGFDPAPYAASLSWR